MSSPPTVADCTPADPPSRLARLWLLLRRTAVFVFVVWQLFFLLFRNPIDSWRDRLSAAFGPRAEWGLAGDIFGRLDHWTTRYGAFFGVEQGWPMFSGPLSRSGPFPAVEIIFADGTEELILSANEPADPNSYFRLGGERMRKLEDYLTNSAAGAPYGGERELWRRYALDAVRRFRAAKPDDPRTPVRAVFWSRRYFYTRPDQAPGERDPMMPVILVEFDLTEPTDRPPWPPTVFPLHP
jgi:hypothetical protein